jgi:hypothetical protein
LSETVRLSRHPASSYLTEKEFKVSSRKPTVFENAKANQREVILADQEHLRKTAEDFVDWENPEEVLLHRSEERKEKRKLILDRHVPDRVCPSCKMLRSQPDQWVIKKDSGLVICRSCFGLIQQHQPIMERKDIEGSLFTPLIRYAYNCTDLVRARESIGISQSKFAEAAGWSRVYQSQLENGDYASLSSETHDVILGVFKRNNVFFDDTVEDTTGFLPDEIQNIE